MEMGYDRLGSSSMLATVGGLKAIIQLCFVLAFAIAFGRMLALTKASELIENFILKNFLPGISVLTAIVVIFYCWERHSFSVNWLPRR